jgi:hypothetical protein
MVEWFARGVKEYAGSVQDETLGWALGAGIADASLWPGARSECGRADNWGLFGGGRGFARRSAAGVCERVEDENGA